MKRFGQRYQNFTNTFDIISFDYDSNIEDDNEEENNEKENYEEENNEEENHKEENNKEENNEEENNEEENNEETLFPNIQDQYGFHFSPISPGEPYFLSKQNLQLFSKDSSQVRIYQDQRLEKNHSRFSSEKIKGFEAEGQARIEAILKLLSRNSVFQEYSEILTSKFNNSAPLFVSWLCTTVSELLKDEPNVLYCKGPAIICSDIHGHLQDLLTVFKIIGLPPQKNFIFLGDYVDRGKQSVEVMCILLILKYKYPKNVFLLRGNHETVIPRNNDSNIINECKEKLSEECVNFFELVFESLPLALVLNQCVFCVHGGLARNLKKYDPKKIHLLKVNDINKINRFTNFIYGIDPLCDLLWSDPDKTVRESGESPRGKGFLWGLNPYKRFMEKNNMKMFVRGHQTYTSNQEYPFFHDKSLITVYTSSTEDHSGIFLEFGSSNYLYKVYKLQYKKNNSKHNIMIDSQKLLEDSISKGANINTKDIFYQYILISFLINII